MVTAQPGDVYVHGSGATAEILAASEERLEFRLTLPPRTGLLPEHVHPHQVETFRVESGEGRYRLAGVDGRLAAGQALEVPAGVRHVNLWNDPGEQRGGARDNAAPAPLVIHQTISPVLDFMDLVTRRLGYRKR
jgi:Cupin domain